MSSTRWAIAFLGGGPDIDGEGFTGTNWHVARILGLGGLSDCDGLSGVTELHCGVTGGIPSEGISSEPDSSEVTGEDAVV